MKRSTPHKALLTVLIALVMVTVTDLRATEKETQTITGLVEAFETNRDNVTSKEKARPKKK